MARRRQQRNIIWLTVIVVGWVGWYLAGMNRVTVTVVDDLGQAVPGAEIRAGGSVVATTDETGRADLAFRGNPTFDLVAAGFRPSWFVASVEESVLDLEPYVLSGRVVDGDGAPVPGASVRSGSASAVTDAVGRFKLRGGEPGRAIAWRPAWTEGALEWDGSPGRLDLVIEPLVIRTFHVGVDLAGDPTRWEQAVNLIDATDLNGVMLDLKDETGLVWYDTQVALAAEGGAVDVRFDLNGIAQQLEEKDVYLIGRIVVFQDPTMAFARPDMAVGWNGAVYVRNGQAFLDPTDIAARQYALDLAVEACRLGVDEIQLDYIRYPDDFPDDATFDGPSDQGGRVKTISSFLAEARSLLHPLGCAVAADVFGFTTTASDDGGIGQHWETVAAELDVISPMLYPSHYGRGWFNYDVPTENPGGVVRAALTDGIPRLGTPTIIRPWLQDFGYTPEQVREQIEVAESFGLGWMLWNAVSDVTEAALD